MVHATIMTQKSCRQCPIFLLATVIVKYPFVTPETTQRFGMEKTIEKTKTIGHGGQLFCVILAAVTTVIGLLS